MKSKILSRFINRLPKFTFHFNKKSSKKSEKLKFKFSPVSGLKNLKIGNKMLGAFGGTVVILVILGIIISISILRLNDTYSKVNTQNVKPMGITSQININVQNINVSLSNMLLDGDVNNISSYETDAYN
ncbi:MAG: MCP four helix bundle domain-containing protein, partial [Bacteroidota bacterium]|nr:MCP four helix bundle domain-containing protein [Bacteroidota bacterium]